MKKLIFASLACVLMIVACKKDDSSNDNTTTTATTSTTATTGTTDPTEKIIEIKTSFGIMYMWLNKETPLHRDNFLSLAGTSFFDSTTFHRCVANFVIQGGDPNSIDTDSTNDGTGGPGYTIPAEIDSSKFKHIYGAVGAARTNNPAKASSGSQFYIVIPQNGTPQLDGNYTVFGKIIKGMEVAEQIVAQPKNANGRPYTDIRMDVNVVEKTLQQLKDDFDFVP
jgi:cyclophilin family peptidyl-prolyl cis-trans isomerase